MTARDRLIFALDVATAGEARGWVRRLDTEVGAFKVGLELFTSQGPALVRDLVNRGCRIFLDLKLHDIPATMAGAARVAGGSGAFLVNVHALAGPEGMARAGEAAREGARAAERPEPKVLAVTVLTSHGPSDLEAVGLRGPASEAVLRLAFLARSAGLDGVVASPLEASSIRRAWPEALIVTPGVRPAGFDAGDQTRMDTAAGALRAGADYLVVGRPIREATDPVATARALVAEMEGAEGPA
ncbi:MAG: orotidine-5'-phosphate decarboxylase [Deferrisomatales bacterium]|nr:orotidine-5'-phosphate decarboxylase [Deferrisomatales bacterium]